ncbi:MAG: PQQ-dependent sugar dehydrogenase [Phycisphaerales bacterium]
MAGCGGAGPDPSDSKLTTTAFEPSPIHITLDDIPEPFHSDSARKGPEVVPIPRDATLMAPAGFRVEVFASGLDAPRWLALTPEGDVLVTETRANRIRRLIDADGDGAVDEMKIFAEDSNGLNLPFGMAFRPIAASADLDDFTFYLGNTNEVRAYPYRRNQGQLEGPGERVVALPGEGYRQHWTRNVVLAPDGNRLFISVGSQSNVDEEPLPRASVQVVDLMTEPASLETWASGLRNPVGLDFHPTSGALYTTVNERDGLGDDLVPDYFTRIEAGEFYGWPYAYLKPEWLDPRRTTTTGASERPDLAARTKTPDVLFQSHSAALGLAFYDPAIDGFPERYRHGAYVAMRGSWNRDRGTGYKIVFVPFDPATNRPLGHYEDFVRGFLIDPDGPTTWGRPVGMLALPDGSLLFTEEMNNRIYRVSYERDG